MSFPSTAPPPKKQRHAPGRVPVEELKLTRGQPAPAVIKATEVMIAREPA